MHTEEVRDSDECRRSARSVSRAQGVDRVGALLHVLYRCAKRDEDRRFHVLYDKVAGSDVLWRAWGEVRANRGAAGVDGITVDDVVHLRTDRGDPRYPDVVLVDRTRTSTRRSGKPATWGRARASSMHGKGERDSDECRIG